MLRFAPAAAARAESVGAHREAAAQYARALRFACRAAARAAVELLEGRSRSAFRADDCDEAIEAMSEALDGHRALGDRLKEGDGCAGSPACSSAPATAAGTRRAPARKP